jgi:DNA-3-methyladenine glycosylase II
MTPDYWPKAIAHLKKSDKQLAAIIKAYHGDKLQLRGDGFRTLARAIVGQQISVKAADSVWKKFEAAVKKVTPANVANADFKILRPCGLSERKVIYMHALANHFLENKKMIKNWPKMEDEAIIKELTSIKGIGRWTAEMFLIFGLGRPDVFPTGDLGLIKGIYRHYNASRPLPLKKVIEIGESWRPYRSVGTWYMWRALDPVPIEY